MMSLDKSKLLSSAVMLIAFLLSAGPLAAETLDELRAWRDKQLSGYKAQHDAKVQQQVPKRPDGTIDTSSPEYRRLDQEYQTQREALRQEFVERDQLSRGTQLKQTLDRYKGRVENTGSLPKDPYADIDIKANDVDAARQLSEEWSKTKGGKPVTYHTIDNPEGTTKPPKDWSKVVKVVNPNTDTTMWTPETPEINAAKAADPDAWITQGGLKGTGNRTMSRDATGYALDNEAKFTHADTPSAGERAIQGLHDEDLKTMAKSVSKAGTGGLNPKTGNRAYPVDLEKSNPEFYEQARKLQEYGDARAAGILDGTETPEQARQKVEAWKQKARDEMAKAKERSAKLSEKSKAARESLEDQMRKSGNDDIADRIKSNREAIEQSNAKAQEKIAKERAKAGQGAGAADQAAEEAGKSAGKSGAGAVDEAAEEAGKSVAGSGTVDEAAEGAAAAAGEPAATKMRSPSAVQGDEELAELAKGKGNKVDINKIGRGKETAEEIAERLGIGKSTGRVDPSKPKPVTGDPDLANRADPNRPHVKAPAEDDLARLVEEAKQKAAAREASSKAQTKIGPAAGAGDEAAARAAAGEGAEQAAGKLGAKGDVAVIKGPAKVTPLDSPGPAARASSAAEEAAEATLKGKSSFQPPTMGQKAAGVMEEIGERIGKADKAAAKAAGIAAELPAGASAARRGVNAAGGAALKGAAVLGTAYSGYNVGHKAGEAGVAYRKAQAELAKAEAAKQSGDLAAAQRHGKRAQGYIEDAKAKGMDAAEMAATEAAIGVVASKVAATTVGGAALGAAAAGAAGYMGTRAVIENTETGQRFEDAKAEGVSIGMSKAEDLGRKWRGEKTRDELADEMLRRRQQAWADKLAKGEIELQPGWTEEDLAAHIASMHRRGKTANMNNLGELGDVVQVVPKPDSGKSEDGKEKSSGGCDPNDRGCYDAGDDPGGKWSENNVAGVDPNTIPIIGGGGTRQSDGVPRQNQASGGEAIGGGYGRDPILEEENRRREQEEANNGPNGPYPPHGGRGERGPRSNIGSDDLKPTFPDDPDTGGRQPEPTSTASTGPSGPTGGGEVSPSGGTTRQPSPQGNTGTSGKGKKKPGPKTDKKKPKLCKKSCCGKVQMVPCKESKKTAKKPKRKSRTNTARTNPTGCRWKLGTIAGFGARSGWFCECAGGKRFSALATKYCGRKPPDPKNGTSSKDSCGPITNAASNAEKDAYFECVRRTARRK